MAPSCSKPMYHAGIIARDLSSSLCEGTHFRNNTQAVEAMRLDQGVGGTDGLPIGGNGNSWFSGHFERSSADCQLAHVCTRYYFNKPGRAPHLNDMTLQLTSNRVSTACTHTLAEGRPTAWLSSHSVEPWAGKGRTDVKVLISR